MSHNGLGEGSQKIRLRVEIASISLGACARIREQSPGPRSLVMRRGRASRRHLGVAETCRELRIPARSVRVPEYSRSVLLRFRSGDQSAKVAGENRHVVGPGCGSRPNGGLTAEINRRKGDNMPRIHKPINEKARKRADEEFNQKHPHRKSRPLTSFHHDAHLGEQWVRMYKHHGGRVQARPPVVAGAGKTTLAACMKPGKKFLEVYVYLVEMKGGDPWGHVGLILQQKDGHVHPIQPSGGEPQPPRHRPMAISAPGSATGGRGSCTPW